MKNKYQLSLSILKLNDLVDMDMWKEQTIVHRIGKRI